MFHVDADVLLVEVAGPAARHHVCNTAWMCTCLVAWHRIYCLPVTGLCWADGQFTIYCLRHFRIDGTAVQPQLVEP
jgi:hypothetical protein